MLSGEIDLTPPLKEDDDAVVKRLSTVRGIGPWTAVLKQGGTDVTLG